MPSFIRFTEQILMAEQLGTVREIGRQIGVRSPASKKKDVLIREIMGVQDGTVSPVINLNKGAPVKGGIDISRFYAKPGEGIEVKPYEITFSDVDVSDRLKPFVLEGVLERSSEGYGFLRANNYENSDQDAYVSRINIDKYKLRRGDKIKAIVKRNVHREADSPALQEVLSINDLPPEVFKNRADFDKLVPCYPEERITLEIGKDVSTRIIDLFSPIGFGQRGLIVAPPKTGKTTLIKTIATAIEKNYKDVKLIVLLIDERPEEVTDIQRAVKGEVVFSTFDERPEHHIRASELVINRAKRLVEVGQNVVVLMDSITRLARAYNSVVESSGKTLTGGLDPAALFGPKRFFGSARNIENGGSLTVISTALVDTGSRMDDFIFEEFKGTGNMEIHLSRSLAENRVFPAIDLKKSSTRKDELLLSEEEFKAVNKLRRIICKNDDATEMAIDCIERTKSNADLIAKIDDWINLYNR